MILPDCMMPDGAEPCQAFKELERERDALRFTQTSGTYAICAKHPRIFSPDKRMPCPACDRDAAIAALKEREIERLRVDLDKARRGCARDQRATQWCATAADMQRERDAAIAAKERVVSLLRWARPFIGYAADVPDLLKGVEEVLNNDD